MELDRPTYISAYSNLALCIAVANTSKVKTLSKTTTAQTPTPLSHGSRAAERDKTLESGGRRVARRSGGARPRPIPTLTTRIAAARKPDGPPTPAPHPRRTRRWTTPPLH